MLIGIWGRIREALRPDWALDIGGVPSNDVDTPVSLLDSESGNQDSLGAEGGTGPSPLAGRAEEASPELLKCYEEIASLRCRIHDLENGLAEESAISETLSRLRLLAKQGREPQVGRPPKPHCKMMLNLLKEWSLLYELGVSTRVIWCNKTTFINNAVEHYLKTAYPELYSVYLRSLSEELSEQNSPSPQHCSRKEIIHENVPINY